MVNFGPLLRGQHHYSDVFNCVWYLFNPKITGSLRMRLGPKAQSRIVGFEILSTLNVTP